MSRPFSTKSVVETKLTPIKVVSTLDLKDLAPEVFDKSMVSIERRFPFVDRKSGSGMRRTVSPDVDKGFEKNRGYLFVNIGFSNVVPNLHLLISTWTTKLIGVKGQDKVVLFGDVKHLICEDFNVIAGISKENIIFREDLIIPKETSYLVICDSHFEDALVQLNAFLESAALDLSSEKANLGHYGECLALLYAFVFRGAVFTKMKLDLVRGLEYKYFGSEVTPPEVLELNNHWEQISTTWYSGQPKWKGILIDSAIRIVKYSPTAALEDVKESKWVDTRPLTNLLNSCSWRTSKEAVINAWEAAKLGYDEEEYFEEAQFDSEDGKIKARLAWKEAVKIFY